VEHLIAPPIPSRSFEATKPIDAASERSRGYVCLRPQQNACPLLVFRIAQTLSSMTDEAKEKIHEWIRWVEICINLHELAAH